MATVKQRIAVSLSSEAERIIPALARKRRMPAATLASKLIDRALELEEDRLLSGVADARFSEKISRWLSHNSVWKKKRIGVSRTTRK